MEYSLCINHASYLVLGHQHTTRAADSSCDIPQWAHSNQNLVVLSPTTATNACLSGFHALMRQSAPYLIRASVSSLVSVQSKPAWKLSKAQAKFVTCTRSSNQSLGRVMKGGHDFMRVMIAVQVCLRAKSKM